MVYSYSSSGVQRLFYAQGSKSFFQKKFVFHAKSSDDLLFSNLQKSSPRPYGCPPPSKIVIYTKTFAQGLIKLHVLWPFSRFYSSTQKNLSVTFLFFQSPFGCSPAGCPGPGHPSHPLWTPLYSIKRNSIAYSKLIHIQKL